MQYELVFFFNLALCIMLMSRRMYDHTHPPWVLDKPEIETVVKNTPPPQVLDKPEIETIVRKSVSWTCCQKH